MGKYVQSDENIGEETELGAGFVEESQGGRMACIIYYAHTLLWLESRSCEAAKDVLLNELIMLVNLEHYVPGIIQVL